MLDRVRVGKDHVQPHAYWLGRALQLRVERKAGGRRAYWVRCRISRGFNDCPRAYGDGVAPRFGAFGSVVGGSVVVFVEGLVMLGLCRLVWVGWEARVAFW